MKETRLYKLEWSDEECYVEAESLEEAVALWRAHMKRMSDPPTSDMDFERKEPAHAYMVSRDPAIRA